MVSLRCRRQVTPQSPKILHRSTPDVTTFQTPRHQHHDVTVTSLHTGNAAARARLKTCAPGDGNGKLSVVAIDTGLQQSTLETTDRSQTLKTWLKSPHNIATTQATHVINPYNSATWHMVTKSTPLVIFAVINKSSLTSKQGCVAKILCHLNC